MREMTEATYNAIKSRNMTGANRFNHKVMIEGEAVGYSDIKSNIVKTNDNVTWFDYEQLDNGKVLVAYVYSLSVYLLTLDNIEQLIENNNIITGGTLFATLNGRTASRCISLSKIRNGEILLFVHDAGVPNVSPQTLKVYASSNGKDFSLRSTVHSVIRTSATSINSKNVVTKPVQSENGKMFLFATSPETTEHNFHRVYSSDDNGVTWVSKKTVGSTFHYSDVWYSGDFVEIGNLIFATFYTSIAYTMGMIVWSNDGGDTWNVKTESFNSWPSYDAYLKAAVLVYNPAEKRMYASAFSPSLYGRFAIYKSGEVPELVDIDWIRSFSNWALMLDNLPMVSYSANIRSLPSGHILYNSAGFINGYTRELLDSKFKAQSITISKSHGGASTATIQVDNKNGVVNPRNIDGPLYKILNLNKQVIIKQGYGDDLVDSFTGIIDSINMTTFPQLATVSLRDNFKKALDQTVTKGGKNVFKYAHQPIENIVTDLCNLCGLTIGFIEPTGISIEKEFSWQSYADAFQFLSDIASFEYLCDESGKFHFRRDFQPGNMQVAWSFEEGVDITNMSYSLDDNDLYNSVRVYGKSGDNILVYNAPFLDAAQFNILPQKVLKIDATETATMAEIEKIAQRAISTMRSRTRVIEFSAIAIPHLQTGDFIQVFESSTDTHEIYRLIGINLTMTDKTFMMNCKAYYYGDSIVPGELPDTTATQTPDPNLNLIPEMNSNTAPSGVARASSVYKDWQATYSPWRSLNGDDKDFFWDANTRVAWLEYEFPEKTIVDKYIIRARETILYNKAVPKDWTFEAFDGEKWIVLDTRTNQINWQIYEERAFLFANTTAYAKYRINITRNNGYVRTQFERLKMYYGGGS